MKQSRREFLKSASIAAAGVTAGTLGMSADKDLDAVIIATADFQHALHAAEAAGQKKHAYVGKPFAETMEIYYSNGGELNVETNKVSSNGGLTGKEALVMGMKPFLLPEMDLTDRSVKVATAAATGVDEMTSLHMRNWLECVRSGKQPNAPVEAGYYHSVSTIMTTAALRTGKVARCDEQRREVLAGGDVFQY